MINEITYAVRGAAFKVHRVLGPGLLESAYEACLHHELLRSGLHTQRQVGLPIIYHEVKLDVGYRLDLLVEHQVIVEIKAVKVTTPVHTAQLLTYLRLANKPIGLLINFHTRNLQQGIQRFAL